MGDDGIQIDGQQFWERLEKLHKGWLAGREQADGLFKGCDAIVIDSGANDEETLYCKSKSLQTWLLGYEFTETVLVICFRAVYVLASKKKVQHLEPMKNHANAMLPLELLPREKADGNKANFAALVTALQSSHAGKTVATLGKEKPLGDFALGWRAALEASGLAQVELAPALADVLAVKDPSEVSCTKRASIFSAMLLLKHLTPKLEKAIDEERKVTHEELAQGTEDAFGDPMKLGVKLPADLLEPCYTPIIQSGGEFDLKPSASSNEKNLYHGVITTCLGARYKSYCSNVGRTYVINPSKGTEKLYKLLMEMQAEAISALRPGAALSAAYHAALNRLKSKGGDKFEKKMTKNVGFATGLEFREASLQLNGKNEAVVKAGMTFNVAVGLEDLDDKEATDKRGQKFALFLADTIIVKEEGPPEVLTEKAPKAWTEISYYLNQDGDEPVVTVETGRRGDVEIKESRTRGAGKQVAANMEQSEQISNHQAELEEQIRVDALERLSKGGAGSSGPSGPQETPIAYTDANACPPQLKSNTTYVDGKAETVLIPMYGQLVPFHVSTIKNVSKNDEAGATYLRINFVSPTAAGAGTGMPKEADGESHYIREITLKSRNASNLNSTFMKIKELRKRVQQREKQEALEADLVEQVSLQLIKAGKVHRLRDCYVRPTVGGKKSSGTLELHANGLRFVTGRGEKLDIIFRNIKLALFQAAEKEIIVLLHFHLVHPIMIAKKKTRDVQFYVEVMEASYALDSARRSGYDPDELEEEQRERQLRKRMNAEFQNFAKKIEEQAGDGFEFDIPYRDLGFYGVPPHNKSTCFVMPAVHALVELTEPPWFVVPLNDIEVASFERVVYGLKNFDVTLVMKDFTQKPVQVSAINIEHLESLKTWLDNCNIKFYEGTANLNWPQIIKHITGMGLSEFYEEGGWKNVLGMYDESGEEGEESEEEDEYAPEGSDSEEEESSSDEYEDEVDSEDSEDSGEESLDSDESEGKDFDELEEEATKEDKKRGRFEEDDNKNKGKKGKKKRDDYSDGGESESDEKPKKKQKPGAPSGGKPGSSGKSSKPAASGKSFMKRA